MLKKMECLNAEGVKTAVKAGLGFGLLFEEHISPELRAGLLRPVNLPLLEDVSVPCYAVYSANKPPGPVLGGFIELLRAHGKSGNRCPVTGHPASDTGNRTSPLPPGTTKGTRV